METFLKRDFKSFAFIMALTAFGGSLALIIAWELTKTQLLGNVFTMISSIFTALGLFLSISKDRKKHKE